MKKSIALAITILAIGLMAGLMHRHELAGLRQIHTQLSAQAARLGIHATDHNRSAQPRTNKLEFQDRETLKRSIVARIGEYGRALDDDDLIDGENSPAVQEQGWELMERLMDLDPEDIINVIGSLQSDESLPCRQELIDLSIRMLAENHPAAALSLLAGSEDLMKEMDDGQALIGESLQNWAKKDPAAALTWAQENSDKNIPLSPGDMESSTLAGASQLDPQLAFKLLSKVKTKMGDAIQAITGSARSAQDRTLILAALRNYLTTISEPAERDVLREKALGGFAESFSCEVHDSAVNWISGQNFSAEECDELVRHLSYETTGADTGKWVEWMSRTLPPESLGERVGSLISSWAKEDNQAVAKWLNGQPDGPMKTAAVNNYARTVVEIAPQVAAQWAMTMPAGQEREETLKRIYHCWQKKDAASAKATLQGMGIPLETIDSINSQSGLGDDH